MDETYCLSHTCCPQCGSDVIQVTTLGMWGDATADTNHAACCGDGCDWQGIVDDLKPVIET